MRLPHFDIALPLELLSLLGTRAAQRFFAVRQGLRECRRRQDQASGDRDREA